MMLGHSDDSCGQSILDQLMMLEQCGFQVEETGITAIVLIVDNLGNRDGGSFEFERGPDVVVVTDLHEVKA